ncbi:MAG: hypothetical protein ACLFVQ_13660 [Chitinispirillaceae bacterium]
MRICKYHAVLLVASFLVVCQKQVEKPVVTVGRRILGQENLEAFKKVAGIYPAPNPHYFPGDREKVSHMVDCEAIYQERKSGKLEKKITGSLDWEWKKKYYTSSLYFDLFETLGFTEEQLKEYYTANSERFRKQIKTEEGKDSSFTPSFENVKNDVADELFYETYKPDSQFIAKLGEKANDSSALKNHWIYSARSNPPDFFLPRIFKEKFAEPLSDSVEQFYGEGKTITPRDLDVILTWVSENQKAQMSTDNLIKWLLKWELFSEQAIKLGLTEKPAYKEIMHWALRTEYARNYLAEEILPQLSQQETTDTTLALLAYYDRIGRVTKPDSSVISSELQKIAEFKLRTKIDSAIYDIRKSAGIAFHQSDWKDQRNADYDSLLAVADSLKEASADPDLDQNKASQLLDKAEEMYRTLAENFAFTDEGRKAYKEVAQILIDKYKSKPDAQKFLLHSAISYYRKGLVLDHSKESGCNSLFMIGFTYDENLKNYELAEANYKWILKNSPECQLASDAEFMMLHLGEPMTSIEEIQGQTMRQGKKVDFTE